MINRLSASMVPRSAASFLLIGWAAAVGLRAACAGPAPTLLVAGSFT